MNKPEPNAPCHCGSGKPYGQCCQHLDILQSILHPEQTPAPPQTVAPSNDVTLQTAVQHHQNGRLPEAEALYRQVLQSEPEHSGALHMLGVLAHQVGRNDAALELIGKSVSIAPDNPGYYLNLGVVLQQEGQYDNARICFQRATELQPDYADAWLNLGNIQMNLQQMDGALVSFSKALDITPNNAEAHHNLGSILMAKGLLNEAIACYRQAIALRPDSAAAHNNLGQALGRQGNHEEAITCYNEALRLEPSFVPALINLGNTLAAQGRLEEACAHYRQVLAVQPDSATAHNNLGSMLQEQGQLTEAIDCYQHAIALQPDYADAHYNLGQAFHAQGLLNDAIESYYRALEIQPNYLNAYYNLGNALQAQGRLLEAVVNYQLALAIDPRHVDALCNLGKTFQLQNRLEEALDHYRQALEINPDHAETYSNLGGVYKAQNRIDDAIQAYRKALELRSGLAEAHDNLGTLLHMQGDTAQAVSSYRQALVCRPDYVAAYSNLIYTMNHADAYSPEQCLEEARIFGKIVTRYAQPFTSWDCLKDAQPERLKIGLVSGDLRSHPVGHFLCGVLENVDPGKVEVIAYPTHFEEDAVTARLRPHLAGWKPLTGMTDKAASQLIHDDGVHVLFDLSGHTAMNRLSLFAWRPAPVQASWLGYFATTGVAEMDYLMGDPRVTPPGEEHQVTEKIWRLPDGYFCMTPPDVDVDVAPLPAAAAGQVTFGCFNNLVKMNERVVALWSRVLQAVPGSRLFLKTNLLGDPQIAEATRQRFAAHGIEAERLVLEGHALRGELLASYHRVDIALDPFPYPGGVTSAESLWMGVPVITRKGDRFLSHVGESVAHSAGMADWIAQDDDDYVAKAVAAAGDLEGLAQLRAGLRQKVLASPLYDAVRFARNFEDAVRGMWQARQAAGR